MIEPSNSPHNTDPVIGKQHEKQAKSAVTGPVIGTAGALGLALYKFKFVVLTALKGLSLVKLGWILKGSASMLLSLGLYTLLFGWRYAVTLIALIYMHEMGHYLWMKVRGLEPNAPVFIPLIGAYTAMKKMPDDPIIHAEVAYAGPLIGGAAAIGLYFLAQNTDNFYLLAAANTGLVLNLLQLLPMRPFDGGFIAACISKKLAVAGVIMTALLALMLQSILLLILTVVGFLVLVRSKKNETSKMPVTPNAIPSAFDRLRISAGYFGLAGALGWFYWLSESQLLHIVRQH